MFCVDRVLFFDKTADIFHFSYQDASELRSRHLSARAAKASSVSARAAAVESRAAARCATVAAKVERKLESASEARRRRLDSISFKAADAAARVKSAALSQRREQRDARAAVDDKLRDAQRRREAWTNRVALKASFFVLRAARAVVHAEAIVQTTAAVTQAKLAARLANAETLKELDVRLRKCKASLVVERASHVVARRRLSDSVAPVLGAARLKAQLARAHSRRESQVGAVAAKARHFVRRAVVTCATNEVRAARNSEEKRASLDARIEGATRRKRMFLELGVAGLGHPIGGGGPSPSPSPSPARFGRDTHGRRASSASTELASRFSQVAERPTTSRGVQTQRVETAHVVL